MTGLPAIDPVALAAELVRRPSVTPQDAGALDRVQAALEALGFTVWRLPFEEPGYARVDNLYARRGAGGPNFCFAGHTDVVPPGDAAAWTHPPFAGVVADGFLWGRGAADMKGAIAAFIAAAARFIGDDPGFGGAVSLLITGDEEGEAVNGTRKVLDWLAARGERLDACLVGEPTNPEALGDMMKIGRRGSLNATLTVAGAQGHVAYPHRADNPTHRLTRMLAALIDTPLDAGSAHFDPSSLQITSVDVGNAAPNVIPARAAARFNIRFNDLHSGAGVERWIRARLDAVGGGYALETRLSGESFLTTPGPLTDLAAEAVAAVTGRRPALSTSGGTSDARFLHTVCPVVEFGLVGRTIHQVDERAATADIAGLADIYHALLTRWFGRTRP